MKKILVSALLGMCALTGFAQAKWDAKVGMSISNISKMESDAKPGFTLGVGMDYQFTDMWYLRSGLNFTSKGCKDSYEESDEFGSVKYTTKLNPVYLEIPVLAAAKFSVSESMKLVVNAGPYLAFGIGGKGSEDIELTGEYVDFADEFPGDDSYKLFSKEDGEDEAMMNRFDFGIQYGVGLEINDKFLINLSGQNGLISPMNGDVYNEKGDKISPKNTSFLLTLGYRF